MIPKIDIREFAYNLPSERIAKYPLERRDRSKLLVYDKGNLLDDNFSNLSAHIDDCSILVFNDTRVVPARLYFRKQTGALIEILCLNPYSPKEYVLSFSSRGSCCWKAVVGNAKKWKGDKIYSIGNEELGLDLTAEIVEKGEESIVKFTWSSDLSFSEILDRCGSVPIPPYLQRESEEIDRSRYQTIYAKYEGSVAAPTAGLHFTDEIFKSLKNKNIITQSVCLHVGAGTFKPVKSDLIEQHQMHTEPFSVTRELLELLYNNVNQVVSVGTTSTRTLESLYYIGVNLLSNSSSSPFLVEQWAPYTSEYKYTFKEAIYAIIDYMLKKDMQRLYCDTSIIIVPSFKFRVVDKLITNFHQPQSTLLLLISAMIGDSWKKVYSKALESDYRFLSYGDSSILTNDFKISH